MTRPGMTRPGMTRPRPDETQTGETQTGETQTIRDEGAGPGFTIPLHDGARAGKLTRK